MTTFGFSAFLKMLSLNARPQRTEMRGRLRPSEASGYDFHRQFRLLAQRYLGGGEPLHELIAEANGFGNAAEGRAAREALQFLQEWRGRTPGVLRTFGPKTWVSPAAAFGVRYTPDFGIEIAGVPVAVHIWKTMRPDLDARMTYAALSLFEDAYDEDPDPPRDLGVLSVVDGRLYRLSDVADQSVLAAGVVRFMENLIEEVREEGPRQGPPMGDRPGAGA